MARRALTLREGRAPVWDRLLTMLFLAGLLHGLIIVGLTFSAAASNTASAPGLEVLLVSDELPEADKNPTATYLAQRTQVGSGNTRKAVAPRNRTASIPTLKHAGTPEGNSLNDAAQAAGKSQDEQVLTSMAWSTNVRYLADAGEAGSVHDQPLLIDQPPTASPDPTSRGRHSCAGRSATSCGSRLTPARRRWRRTWTAGGARSSASAPSTTPLWRAWPVLPAARWSRSASPQTASSTACSSAAPAAARSLTRRRWRS